MRTWERSRATLCGVAPAVCAAAGNESEACRSSTSVPSMSRPATSTVSLWEPEVWGSRKRSSAARPGGLIAPSASGRGRSDGTDAKNLKPLRCKKCAVARRSPTFVSSRTLRRICAMSSAVRRFAGLLASSWRPSNIARSSADEEAREGARPVLPCHCSPTVGAACRCLCRHQ
jgi:hypothetical protein